MTFWFVDYARKEIQKKSLGGQRTHLFKSGNWIWNWKSNILYETRLIKQKWDLSMFLALNQFEWKGFYELQFITCFTLNLSRKMYQHNRHGGRMVFRQSSSIDIVNKISISKLRWIRLAKAMFMLSVLKLFLINILPRQVNLCL